MVSCSCRDGSLACHVAIADSYNTTEFIELFRTFIAGLSACQVIFQVFPSNRSSFPPPASETEPHTPAVDINKFDTRMNIYFLMVFYFCSPSTDTLHRSCSYHFTVCQAILLAYSIYQNQHLSFQCGVQMPSPILGATIMNSQQNFPYVY